MRLLIVALNAKYTHTSLAAYCLYGAVRDICDASCLEYTINDSPDDITWDIYSKNPDCVAFSCYIWNIENVLKIASVLKKANPGLKIVLGGHEAEHDAEKILEKYHFIDAVLRGEGEISLKHYAGYLTGKRAINSCCLITYREDGKIVSLPSADKCVDLNEMPFVYDESIDNIKNRIIYYETSRGCPYSCTYCLSGESHRVRFLNVERVKKELGFFMDKKVPLVKFVDRTFNADVKRALEIFKFIADNPSDTCFHMELSGGLIDDETLEVLSKVKKGAMQFEIGVQTTNPHTMDAIERRVSFDKLKYAVKKLMSFDNIHIHLDLIAGLPYETLDSFKSSFREVMTLKPHVLQLGFLKLLKGSKIRMESEKYGYVYHDLPPYEIISNDFISYGELSELKWVENAVDRYYNSGSFKHSLGVIFEKINDSYEVFKKTGEYIKNNYPSGYGFSKQMLFDILYDVYNHLGEAFVSALKKDYLLSFRPGKRPHWMGMHDESCTLKAYEFFKDEEIKSKWFPEYADVPAKEIMKHIHAERFGDAILLFDYKKSTIYDMNLYNNC